MKSMTEKKSFVALFLLAMSVLVLEISMTRVFSFMSWHHFAYLIISLAMLGFGAASTYLTVSPKFHGAHVNNRQVGIYALAFSLSAILGYATVTKIRFFAMDAYLFKDYSNVYSLVLLYVVMGVQFFFAGICIGHLLTKAGDAINRLYFADLMGAAAGALLSIVGINYFGPEATIYMAAAAAGVVAIMFALATEGRWLRVGSYLTLGISLIMAVFATGHTIFPVYSPPGKIFRYSVMHPHYFKWNMLSRIDLKNPAKVPRSEPLISPSYDGEMPLAMVIYQDGGAPTYFYHVPGGDVTTLPILEYDLRVAPYIASTSPKETLVIGVGGGLDVLTAIYYNAKKVVGVDVNPVTVEVVKNEYSDFNGFIFHRPDVELLTAEGRHYLTSSNEKFDLIQLTGVDTYAALSAGAYTLTENYLYTREAIGDYLDHLNDDGMLAILRWLFTPPRESLRLVATQVEALELSGIEDPQRHIMVIATQKVQGKEDRFAETLVKKTAFTISEVMAIRRWAAKMQFEIIYDPYEEMPNAFNQFIRASSVEREKLYKEYPYDIKPCTDDSPFFFRFYRWRWFLNPPKSVGGYLFEFIPLGLAVLLVSLIQILIFASVFIIAPLIPQSVHLRGIPHKKRVLFYFASLGLGFIFVEIALMQKYTVFVGGPVYSMAVTLASILAFSGIGSLLSKRFSQSIPRSLKLIIFSLIAAIIAEMLFVNILMPKLMFLSLPVRCGVTIAALAPLAMLMGMPFPTGLRVAQRLSETIIPWAWGINAVATTLGAILCVMVSMEFGFTVSLWIAGILYLLGLFALSPVVRVLYGTE